MKRISTALLGIFVGVLLTCGVIFGANAVMAGADTAPQTNVLEVPVGDEDAPEDFEDYDCPDWFAIAAETLGIEEDALWEAFEQDQSIAQLAEAQGADLQALSEALTAAETEFTNDLLAAGEITQEEADEWLALLPEEIQLFLNETLADWEMAEGAWEGVDWFGIAIEILNVDEEALWEALENGQTLAAFAETQGADPQALADAIVAAETEWIKDLVAEGTLAQEEADEWLALLPEEVQFFLNEALGDEEVWFDEVWEGVDWFGIAAETLNVDEEALWDALESGQTLAAFAEAQGVDPQAVIDAIVAAETEWVNEWLAELPGEARLFVEEGWDAELEVEAVP
jgi:uncharacterized protein YidB (DUF937 family)